MLHFECDYTVGAHPAVLQKLIDTNLESLPGYGADDYCQSAKQKIAAACGNPNYAVELLTGGTQTNAIIIATMLQDYEGVISAETGHIHAHESGAVEYSGHKILTLPAHNGKIHADQLQNYLEVFHSDSNKEHMVFPGMVYISYPTEYGTLYSKKELEAIHKICRSYHIPLFIDGARLGYGLMSKQCDLTLPELAALCDVFYIGGTKVGALCGEAVVFTNCNKPKHFLTSLKKRGALLAKGRLLGVQFDALFTDGLYFEISRHAISMAETLKAILKNKGYTLFLDSPTNQQFIVMTKTQLEGIEGKVCYSFWEKPDADHTVIRLATSWSTTENDLKELEALL